MCGLEYDDEERRLCWAGTGGGHVLSGVQGSCVDTHGVGSSARGVDQAIMADHSLIVNETSQLRPKKMPFSSIWHQKVQWKGPLLFSNPVKATVSAANKASQPFRFKQQTVN